MENEDSDGFKVSSTPKEIEEEVLSELANEASSWGQFWKDSYNEHDYSDIFYRYECRYELNFY